MEPKVKKWAAGIEILARIVSRFPQTAYAGLVKSLQSEWQYLCRVVPRAERFLGPIESAICEKFIPALLQVSEPVDDALRQLLSHGVKSGGIAILNPVASAPRHSLQGPTRWGWAQRQGPAQSRSQGGGE